MAEPVFVVMAVLVVLVESAAETPSHRRANNHINNYNIRDTEQGNHSGHGKHSRARFYLLDIQCSRLYNVAGNKPTAGGW